MQKNKHYYRWLIQAPLGLMLIGFGTCLVAEGAMLKYDGKPWFWFGTVALCVLNSGLCIFGDSIIQNIKSRTTTNDLAALSCNSTKKYITEGEGIAPTTAPISHAVVVGNFCHISGQLAVGQDGIFRHGTALEEAQIAFENLFAVLKNANFERKDIVFIDIAFTNLNDLAAITPYYDSLFPQGQKPARTIYQAAALPFGGKIKVMATAMK
jgi:2-iminobutanoate/2-iminopropanoate deaminase